MLWPPKAETKAKLRPFAIRRVDEVEATLNCSKSSMRWVRE
jgi:hypothetical protein